MYGVKTRMKVWCVFWIYGDEYNHEQLEGIFDTEEKAEAFLKNHVESSVCEIREWEVK